MKKILSILFVTLVSLMIFPFNANAKNISTLDVKEKDNKLTVSGTTENGVLAVAVFVYSEEDLIHMETCSNNSSKYSCELSKAFENGDYVVKVADYDGGDYISKDIKVSVKENNPNTGDNIMSSFIIGIISVITIIGCAIFINKKKELK